MKKIRIKLGEKNGNNKNDNGKNYKSIKFNRIKLPTRIRMSVIIVLGILALASIFSAAAITPEGAKTVDKQIPVCNYYHGGSFNYVAQLKDNTVYNTTILLPGQATMFKKITDYLNVSLTYSFSCDQSATISGSYKLSAEIQTDIWNKQYTIIPTTIFDTKEFKIDFIVNHSHYEDIVKTINNEIGVTATDPTLVFKCEISINAQTNEGIIIDRFTPALTMPLSGNIIEITGSLRQTKSGALTDTITINIPEEDVGEERGGSLLTAALFALPILPVAVLTKNDDTPVSQLQKQMKKIKKKYGEWIVEVDHLPKRPDGTGIVHMKTMDDIVKISEELGKPVISYKSDIKGYAFVVFDENIHYIYIIKNNRQ